jgi:hypothetical protein
LDEVAFWRDETSSRPDEEVYDAILPALARVPGSMLIGISSPYRKAGLLYRKFKEAKESRLRDLFGLLIDQIAERKNTLQEVEMIVAVARGDIQHASNLAGPDFEAVARPIETRIGAPWVLEDKVTICEVKPDGTAEYHAGSPDELRDAVAYPNLAAFLAARAA